MGVFRVKKLPQGREGLLPCLACPVFFWGPSHDSSTLVKVRMEMTYWSDGEASINLPGPPSRFSSLCKSCQIKDISRWRAMQKIQMEEFLTAPPLQAMTKAVSWEELNWPTSIPGASGERLCPEGGIQDALLWDHPTPNPATTTQSLCLLYANPRFLRGEGRLESMRA